MDWDCTNPNLPAVVKFYLCNYVISQGSGEVFNVPKSIQQHSCTKTIARFVFNPLTARAKKTISGSVTECGNCTSSQTM
jgi:hypothetical protein